MRYGLLALACGLAVAGAPGVSQADDRQRADEHHEQASAFFRVEAYEDAIEEWKASYDLYPNPNRLFNIGRAYEELGDKDEAVRYYREYVEEDPRGQAVSEANARAVSLERQLESQRAEQERRESLSEARSLMSERDYQAAIAAYKRAFEISGDPAIVYEIAQARRLDGDRRAAIAEYDRYLEIAPDGDRAADALAHQQTLESELEAEQDTGSRGAEGTTERTDRGAADMTTEKAAPGGGWSGTRIAGASTMGAGALGLGAGVFFGLRAQSAQSTIEGEGAAWSGDLDDEIDRGEAAQRNMIIATSVGGAALAAGAALYVLDMTRDDSPSALSLSPSLTGSSSGVVLTGSF